MVLPEVMLVAPEFDPVEEASEGSFPASDPPAWTVTTGVGMPCRECGRDGKGGLPVLAPEEKWPEP